MTTRYNLLHSVKLEQRRTLHFSVTEVQSAIYFLRIKGTTESTQLSRTQMLAFRVLQTTSRSGAETFLHLQCIFYLEPSNCSRTQLITPDTYPSTWMLIRRHLLQWLSVLQWRLLKTWCGSGSKFHCVKLLFRTSSIVRIVKTIKYSL